MYHIDIDICWHEDLLKNLSILCATFLGGNYLHSTKYCDARVSVSTGHIIHFCWHLEYSACSNINYGIF